MSPPLCTELHRVGPSKGTDPTATRPNRWTTLLSYTSTNARWWQECDLGHPARLIPSLRPGQVCVAKLEGVTKMNGSWRDEWPPFRIKLVEETARCIVEQRALTSRGAEPSWAELTAAGQALRIEAVAALFGVQDLAMDNLMQRGVVP